MQVHCRSSGREKNSTCSSRFNLVTVASVSGCTSLLLASGRMSCSCCSTLKKTPMSSTSSQCLRASLNQEVGTPSALLGPAPAVLASPAAPAEWVGAIRCTTGFCLISNQALKLGAATKRAYSSTMLFTLPHLSIRMGACLSARAVNRKPSSFQRGTKPSGPGSKYLAKGANSAVVSSKKCLRIASELTKEMRASLLLMSLAFG
mmetsp:Transcript_14065/g.30471  ORF Transcript_14065/g.30471 Transcript_14065/m.30471 type:complete len:204 (-) Transcript_14065:1991-2602(-)